ncbi:hypothetical protein HQ571_05565 [Candidatus Kuenenbacteria bacterium]|nr:hypothetical protein [Candidatus Kuenenbacteria bacterium]
MSEFNLSKTKAVVIALMNACVETLKLGKFMYQLDVASPVSPHLEGRKFTTFGYTDTGMEVSADVLWTPVPETEILNHKFKVVFTHSVNPCDIHTFKWWELKLEHQADAGFVVKDQKVIK